MFLCGVEMERGGQLYEAIQHYKRAIQILPDVESRLYDGSELRADTPEGTFFLKKLPVFRNTHPFYVIIV